MKSIIGLIVTILLISTSCTKNVEQAKKSYSTEIVIYNFDEQFALWLKENNINDSDCIKIKSEEAFELWAYSYPLTKEDSLLFWYPSKDSSYYLITNYNNSTHKRIKNNNIELGFLDVATNEKYIGVLHIDSLETWIIDYYWYDSNSFYYLLKSKYSENTTLIKMEMGVDSIWRKYYLKDKKITSEEINSFIKNL